MRKLLVFVFAFVSLYANSQSVCGGKSTTLTAPNPLGLTGPTYSLNPGGFPSIPGTADFVVSPPGNATYTLYTTGQNTNNVVVTTSVVVQVTVNPQPLSVPVLTLGTCTNSYNAVNLGLTFNPASPVPGYTVTWNPIPPALTNPQQTSVTTLPAGPYTVTIVADGGCATTVTFEVKPQPTPAQFTVTPFGSTHSITCTNPTVELTASNPNLSYTWTGNSFAPVNSQSITLTATNLGTISLTGVHPTSSCSATFTFQLFQNITLPSSTLSATSININCSQTLAPTFSAIASPSVNIKQTIYPPGGLPPFSAYSYTTIFYIPMPGTYTHEALDISNGCLTTKTFVVNSSDNYPIYNVTSPNNFSIGCTTTGTATIKIENAATTPTAGGPVSYTIIGPPTSTTIPTGTLSGNNSYTVNVPGTWTVIVKDNTNNCETRTPIAILQNTFAPSVSAIVPQQILDCNTQSIVLEGIGTSINNANINYNWGFVPPPGSPGNIQGSTITVAVNPAAPTTSLLNTYTLTVTDMNNTCKNTTIIPIYQNTYPPQTLISSQGNPSITCLTKTITLTNQSKTTIPPGTFPSPQPAIGYIWMGPSPQDPLQVSSYYVAGTVGTYTLISKDLNNGCVSQNTFSVFDGRVYPTINAPASTTLDCGEQAKVLEVSYTNTTAASTYSWNSPPTTSITGQTGPRPSVKGPGTYTVLVTNPVSGCQARGIATVVNGSLTASFDASTYSGYAPLTVEFTNTSLSSSTLAGSASSSIASTWNYGNSGTLTTQPNSTIIPQTIYTQPGTYKVTMYAVKGACLDTAERYIKVEIPSSLSVPNVFTPNGDGANDLFFLKATNLVEINITIVDRWGHLVYELVSSTGNVEWDGKNAQGKDAAEGTYFYVLKALGKDGEKYDQKGTISLYR